MSERQGSNEEWVKRASMAAGEPIFDRQFMLKLQELGLDTGDAFSITSDIRARILDEDRGVRCADVRRRLGRLFPRSKNRPLHDLVFNYRREMQIWVNGGSPFKTPPHLALQQLPDLTPDTVNEYLQLLHDLQISYLEFQAPNDGVDQDDLYERHRYEHELRNGPDSLRNIEIRSSMLNLAEVLLDFIDQSEENALQVFVFILHISDVNILGAYVSLCQAAVEKLSANVHFLRSLFHLIDENFYSENPIQRVDLNLVGLFLETLVDCDVLKIADKIPKSNGSKPMDVTVFRARRKDVQTNKVEYRNYIVPAKYLPVHYNTTRLVNPARSPIFQGVASDLQKVEIPSREQEIARFVHELREDRRYGLSFSRVQVRDIEGLEGRDVWIHYSRDDDMDPHAIRVELVVDGASIVYHFDGRVVKMQAGKNAVPDHRKLPGVPKSPHPLLKGVYLFRNALFFASGLSKFFIPTDWDELYGRRFVKVWAPENAQRNLFYHILKNAHALLVSPRSEQKSSKTTPNQVKDNPFGLRLSDHLTELSLGGSSEGESSEAYQITVYHDVCGHKRNLPQGQTASDEAVALAAKHGIILKPGETFVRSHTRGLELSEQGRMGRVIRPENLKED